MKTLTFIIGILLMGAAFGAGPLIATGTGMLLSGSGVLLEACAAGVLLTVAVQPASASVPLAPAPIVRVVPKTMDPKLRLVEVRGGVVLFLERDDGSLVTRYYRPRSPLPAVASAVRVA